MVKFMKNCLKAVFNISKEAYGCTECNAKDPWSLQRTDIEQIRNNFQKYPILIKDTKNGNFWRLFLIFQKQSFLKRWGLLRCVQCIRTIFQSFHHKGGPFWFRGGQNCRQGEDRVKKKKKKKKKKVSESAWQNYRKNGWHKFDECFWVVCQSSTLADTIAFVGPQTRALLNCWSHSGGTTLPG